MVVVDDSTINAVTGDATAQMGSVNELVTDVEVTAGVLTSPANPPGDEFTYKRPVIENIDPPSASAGRRDQAHHHRPRLRSPGRLRLGVLLPSRRWGP